MNVLPPITIPTFIQPIVESAVAWFTITFVAIPASTFFLFWDCPKSVWRFFFNDYPKVVLITGANSGIGAELALAYARKNTIIGLVARDKDRLNAVSKECHKQGATTRIIQCDITNKEELDKYIDSFDNENPIELLIANAAQSGATIDDKSEDSWERALEVNIAGTLATVTSVYKKMRARKKGQIAITASIAGHFSVPQMAFYNATKASLISFARDLRYLAAQHNVKVSVICPGFIDTRLTNEPGQPVASIPKFFKASPCSLAKIIQWQLLENHAEITWPFFEYLPTYATSILPPRLQEVATYAAGKFNGFVTGTGDIAWT
jgi:short-subunit dehydrogenase